MEAAYQQFLLIVHELLIRIYIPHKIITMRDSEPWFVTPLIKTLLRQRNSLYHRGRSQKTQELSTKITKLIGEVN